MPTSILMKATPLLWLLVLPVVAAAQPARIPFHKEPYSLDSGRHQGTTTESATAFREVARVSGAAWIQLRIGEYNLGIKSYVTITSLKDGHWQRLDAKSLPEWYNSTAYFNGDAVEVELHVASSERDIFIRIQEVTVGEVPTPQALIPETICGTTDDRVASADPRVGRIVPVGCTGWIVSNGAHLTAGHCAGATMQILQFNVPPSQANGTIVAPPPQDQYPINAATVTFASNGVGDDWTVFNTNRNANTNLLPVEAQRSYFDMTRDVNPTAVRVTGYGVDGPAPSPACPTCDFGNTGPQDATNQTQQTTSGASLGETVTNANNVRWSYVVDTQPANSGSPIIIEGTGGLTIGIHTAGGCTATGSSNVGTGFEHDGLENAINAFMGPNARYVDGSRIVVEDGTAFGPFNTVTEGVTAVPAGGIVSIVTGAYPEVITINKAMTLSAPVGPVRIGP